jgi:hypothetical protein
VCVCVKCMCVSLSACEQAGICVCACGLHVQPSRLGAVVLCAHSRAHTHKHTTNTHTRAHTRAHAHAHAHAHSHSHAHTLSHSLAYTREQEEAYSPTARVEQWWQCRRDADIGVAAGAMSRLPPRSRTTVQSLPQRVCKQSPPWNGVSCECGWREGREGGSVVAVVVFFSPTAAVLSRPPLMGVKRTSPNPTQNTTRNHTHASRAPLCQHAFSVVHIACRSLRSAGCGVPCAHCTSDGPTECCVV